MRVEFVNHASYVLETGTVRMICDPWLEGTAFDNGWALLSKTSFSYDDFGGITHIWFSHEHPDHFSPPNLKKIPEQHRAKIVVLFQETQDKRVVDYCKKLGFKEVRELPLDEWLPIADGVELFCSSVGGFEDSWLCVRSGGETLLNMNDCFVSDAERLDAILAKVGKVDVLATQFSISAWDGNPEDEARRRGGAVAMLEKAIAQCERLAPRFVIPFASFIWLCHEENAYMNSAFLPIDEVVSTLRARTRATPVLMYPGDAWTVGEAFDSEHATKRYLADQASLATRTTMKSAPVTPEALVEESVSFCRGLFGASDPSRVKVRWAAESYREDTEGASLGDRVRRLAGLARLSVPVTTVYVTDHAKSYEFHPERGLTPSETPRERCDVRVGSAALHYAFKFPWGGQSLFINGRFAEGAPDSRIRLFSYFHMAANHNAGHVLRWKSLPGDVRRRVEGAARRLLRS